MTLLKEKPSKQQIQDKWRSYVEDRDQETRNSLIEHYLPLLASIAKGVHVKLRGHVELDDLTSSGALGLMAAVDSFDPSRGIAFETFCTYRIRGAIFDEVRAMDWVPRLVRARARKLAEAEQALSNQGGFSPTDCELADYMRVTPQALGNIRRDDRNALLISLNTITANNRDQPMSERELDSLSDDGAQDVSRQILGQEFNEIATAGLSKAEVLILKLYYFGEMTMAQVGATLDLSESRVSQIHSAILARLRGNLASHGRDRATPSFSNGPRLAGKAASSPPQRLPLAA